MLNYITQFIDCIIGKRATATTDADTTCNTARRFHFDEPSDDDVATLEAFMDTPDGTALDRQLRNLFIFPHAPIAATDNSYSEWYSRVADVWQRRRAADIEAAPTNGLREVMHNVMSDRLLSAREVSVTLH